MTGAFNFWDFSVWSFVIALSVLFGALMLANMLRRLIKPLRRSLIPAAVIAGFLVLAADGIFTAIVGHSMFEESVLEALTYHGLGLGIVAMSFRSADKEKGRERRRDVFNSGLITVSGYLTQGIVGLAISIALFYLIGSWASAGMLLPMGFGQGPGQAFNWGNIYQSATDYPAFANGASFGLAVAALGFVASSIGGVIYLNAARRKGRLKYMENADESEDLSAEMVTKKGEIPLAESLDKLTVQFGLVFVSYGIAFALMWAISLGLDALGGFFAGTVKPLLWGFNFLTGMMVAYIIKASMRGLKKRGIVHREYTNNFLLNRISGVMFDLMVVASIAAISLAAFEHIEFILPLILICAAGAFVTYFFVRFVSRKLFPDYADEEFLAMYGMLTGTTSTGLILLREADPLYRTPASNNVIFQALWAIVFGFPMLLLMGVVATSMSWTWLTLLLMVLMLGLMLLLLFRKQIFHRKDRADAAEETK